MTLSGWDASHFDGPLTRSTLDTAYAEGIRFFTHKIGEGLADTEGTLDDTALAAARDAGIPFIGGLLEPPRPPPTPPHMDARVRFADTAARSMAGFPPGFWASAHAARTVRHQ